MGIKEIAKISLLSALLIVQKLVFNFLPNISLTVFLIILFSKKLNMIENTIVLLIFTIVDNIIMGSFIMMPFIFIGWLFTPIIVKTLFRKANSPISLACVSILSCLFYILVMFLFTVFVYKVDPLVYLANDVIFDLILISSSFLSVLWLYKPVEHIYTVLERKYYE